MQKMIVLRRLFSVSLAVLMATLFFGCQSSMDHPAGSKPGKTTQVTSSETASSTPTDAQTGTTQLSTTQGVSDMANNSSALGKQTTQNNHGGVSNATQTHMTTQTTLSTGSPQFSQQVRRLCGSFIQPWLVVGWSQIRWEQELQQMSEAGMKYIILQSISDLSFDTEQNLGQNPDVYKVKSSLCLYPSSLAELKGANTGVDSLKSCLAACKKYKMQAIIGPVSDNRWWKYGWGMPQCPVGKWNTVEDSYMTRWVRQNAALSNRVADEVIKKYGKEYGDQIYGWYYNNEIWNIDVACKGQDKGVYAQILGESMSLVLQHYTTLTPGKPMMLSSFMNPDLSTAAQCGKMWQDIFRYTKFRKGDIFSPQDSYGNNPTQDLEAWTKAYADAVKTKSGLVFWSNNENFRKNYAVATLDSFINQINTTAKYASANICFSWNHYYSPSQQNKGYNQAYLKYIRTGKMDNQAPTKPKVAVVGKRIVVDSTDSDGIAGIRIYQNGNVVQTVACRKDNNEAMFKSITLSQSGNYFVETYDFFGNESAKTAFTIS